MRKEMEDDVEPEDVVDLASKEVPELLHTIMELVKITAKCRIDEGTRNEEVTKISKLPSCKLQTPTLQLQ